MIELKIHLVEALRISLHSKKDMRKDLRTSEEYLHGIFTLKQLFVKRIERVLYQNFYRFRRAVRHHTLKILETGSLYILNTSVRLSLAVSLKEF